jgi:colicin import membrane protein
LVRKPANESFADKLRAFALALLVHLACIGVMFLGLLWTHTAVPVSIPGPVIEAELVGPAAAPKPRAAKKPKPAPPKPQPAPPPPPEPPASEPPRNDAVDRERIAELSQQQAEQAQRAQEEKRRQQQIELQGEQKREASERERMKQLADIKRQREAAEKKRKLEQEKLAQLTDLQKSTEKPTPAEVPAAEQARTGMAGQDDSLEAEYFAAIQNAVTQNWLRPDNTPVGLRCTLHIVQIPGGEVLSVEIGNPCNADAQTRASIEQAVKRAAPLPYQGYQKVFRRAINFNFSYDG